VAPSIAVDAMNNPIQESIDISVRMRGQELPKSIHVGYSLAQVHFQIQGSHKLRALPVIGTTCDHGVGWIPKKVEITDT
jgi:hypothetical protein